MVRGLSINSKDMEEEVKVVDAEVIETTVEATEEVSETPVEVKEEVVL